MDLEDLAGLADDIEASDAASEGPPHIATLHAQHLVESQFRKLTSTGILMDVIGKSSFKGSALPLIY